MTSIDCLYIFDEHNRTILEHVYTGRPPSASTILPQYLAHSAPRPSLLHLPSTNPPTLVHSIIHDRLLYLCCTSHDVEPLLVLEFLHRVTDALEDFLGSPLLASKIEASYDVVAQVVGEMCDAGLVCNTEPNALKEVIDTSTWMDNWLGGLNLPSTPAALAGRASNPSLARSQSPFPSSSTGAPTSAAGSAIPWRRANVRHTSNELYVDIVEKLEVIYAPSGRPLSAIANGTIAFTAKISGVPDLILTLTAPGGQTGIGQSMSLPCFHPCVRLARWRERPGELSFVPPDGRFVLAGYECNLLPDIFAAPSITGKIQEPKLNLPVSIEIRTSQGANGDEFEARVTMNPKATAGAEKMQAQAAALSGRIAAMGPGRLGGAGPGASTASGGSGSSAVEDLLVTIPVPPTVRNITELRASKGEAHYLATEGIVEWRISNKEAMTIGSLGATLRCTVVGPLETSDDDYGAQNLSMKTETFDYDDRVPASYQDTVKSPTDARTDSSTLRPQSKSQHTAALMPRSASVSFSVKGWLASGIRVESLVVNAKTSKDVQVSAPYKGVKYLTVSRNGVEIRV